MIIIYKDEYPNLPQSPIAWYINYQKWNELGRTEISYNYNPRFMKSFILNFIFEEEQILRFNIYKSVNDETLLIKNNLLGCTSFKLSEVIKAKC